MTEPAAVIPTSPAEELAQLVTELCDEVTTEEAITRYQVFPATQDEDVAGVVGR
ncbi:hypothetical protein K8Z49_05235 [Actinomadura madurae]|uniref:hypothetical protein n=1 Tax=Actinomadura madurae TaxID=1993 RepID=UPI00399B8FDB